MVDIALPAQLQQWTFEKTVVRPERSNSATVSMELDDTEAVRISPTKADPVPDIKTDRLYQNRYLSSEEDLSPMESGPEFDLDEGEVEIMTAQAIPTSSKPCDLAVVVSYVSAGRPKIVDVPLASPVREKPQRMSSLQNISAARRESAVQIRRFSLATGPERVPSAASSRRPSTAQVHPLQQSTSASSGPASAVTSESSSRDGSQSPSGTNTSRRPSTAKSAFSKYAQSTRASVSVFPTRSSSAPFPPLTPASPLTPQSPSFLDSDPFASATTSAASQATKPAPHKRLRSISRTLSLAKIAVLPSKQRGESRRDSTQLTPTTPMSPMMPGTPSTPASPWLSKRMSSLPAARVFEQKQPPAAPQQEMSYPKPRMKLVPRGADERAPPIELPPFPSDGDMESEAGEGTRRTLRKRKSVLGLS